MFSAIWIATAVGLAGGLVLAYALGNALLPRMVTKSRDALLLVRLAFGGTLVALLPALVLSIVVGGTLGGAWGERAFRPYELPFSGAPFGLALGIAVVFALVLLAGAVSGIWLGRALLRYRKWRARS